MSNKLQTFWSYAEQTVLSRNLQTWNQYMKGKTEGLHESTRSGMAMIATEEERLERVRKMQKDLEVLPEEVAVERKLSDLKIALITLLEVDGR